MNAVLAGTSSLSLPPDSYVYHIAQAGAGLAAISSDDSLRIFDRSTLQLASGGIIEPAHRGLTCLERVAGDHHSIVTAGRDGFVRCWDLRTGSKIRELRDGGLCHGGPPCGVLTILGIDGSFHRDQ